MNTAQPLSPGKSTAPAGATRSLQEGTFGGIDHLLGKVFSLTHRAAQIRRTIVWTIFILICLIVAWQADPIGWKASLQTVLVYLFKIGSSESVMSALGGLLLFGLKTIFFKGVLKHILVLLAPYLLGWHLAALYLQDIFELEHIQPAWSFIMQAALAEQYERIHIRAGSIEPAEIDSPVIQIGGPGYVQVELDSAALVERADGDSYIVGPTLEEGDHYRVLHAFERLREVIDLRDLTTDSLTNTSRSRDGIPVIAKDVRLTYSVRRGNQKSDLERPYPFLDKAIRDLVYQQTTIVSPGQPNFISHSDYWKQSYKRWSSSMPGLIRSSLDDFVSEHSLSEFLANTGEIEQETMQRFEAEIRQASETIAPSEGSDESLPKEPEAEAPPFKPRPMITQLFYDFTSSFSKSAENKGVQLRWIGIGTWGTPASAQLISESHLEAWRISRENYLRGHPETLRQIQELAQLQELQTLLQEVPLANFRESLGDGVPPQEIVHRLLLAYREKIKAAWDLFERDKKARPEAPDTPEKLTQAVSLLNELVAHHLK